MGKNCLLIHLLQLVVIDDVLICWAGLGESVELIHMVHVMPQSCQIRLQMKWFYETADNVYGRID